MKNFLAPALLTAALVQGALVPRDDSTPDFAAIEAQPQPTVQGPTVGAAVQTNVAGNSAAAASGSAAASTTSPSKRGHGCTGWWCPKTTSSTPCSTSSSGGNPWGKPTTPAGGKPTSKPGSPGWPKPTTTPCTTTLVKTSKPAPPATISTSWVKPSTCTTSSYTPYYPATSTTKGTGTGTATYSSSTSCPTTPEPGTYCGFINPEDPCAPQPDGYGPVPTPDTAAGFLGYQPFHQAAENAVTPSGYTEVFKDLNASVSAANYLGLVTLKSYSPEQCAQACQCTELCSSFNIYIERDPSLNPASSCPNPASMTSYKCTLWGGPISSADATNTGQYRGSFQVVVTGSNGYVATPSSAPPPPQPGWGNGHHCPGGGIVDGGHHMGGHFFPGPWDPRVCAAFAEGQTKANRDSCASGGTYQACNLWNAYGLLKDGQFWGMYCSLFTDHPNNSSAELGSYTGGSSGGSNWEVTWSWSQCHDSGNWDYGNKP